MVSVGTVDALLAAPESAVEEGNVVQAAVVQGRIINVSEPVSTPMYAMLWCLAVAWGVIALLSGMFILPGAPMLVMAFDAPGSVNDPRVYLGVLGLLTFPCSAALAAFVAGSWAKYGEIPCCNFVPKVVLGCFLLAPLVNVFCMLLWQ